VNAPAPVTFRAVDVPPSFADRVRRDVPLAPLTTIGIGGPAKIFFTPRDARDAADFLHAAAAAGRRVLVLGSGANLLVADQGVEDAVLHPAELKELRIEGETVRAGAGLGLTELIAATTNVGLGGLEGLAGIPAQVGGAVAMNAGGRYGWISHALIEVETAGPDGLLRTIPRDALACGYRSAVLPPGSVVTAALFRLKPGDRATLKREAGRILKEKNAAQPTTGRNFGCTFVNPEGESAGKLVEAAGLKGLRVGDARISPLHANFVENLGAARAADVLALVERMESEVLARFGVVLKREVRTWP
jgi:UDP-N-acetylenolpyruvoylglucosamine reductase